jgi:hypothetical protein
MIHSNSPVGVYRLGFAAGTPVHTKEGLKPIENIRENDWVLSQPEGTGKHTYKRVMRTICYQGAPLWTITYFPTAELEQAKAENRMMPVGISRRLVVTPNHQFWVKGKGWVQVSDLDFDGDELELCDGQNVMLDRVCPLYRTDTESVAWQEGTFIEWAGSLVNLQDPISTEFDAEYDKNRVVTQPSSVELWTDNSYFRCPVYNIEVEEFHTYYVGTMGVWVHTTSPNSARQSGEHHEP